MAKREPKFDFRGRAGETSNPLFRGFGNQSAEEVQRYDQPVLMRLNTRDEVELRAGFPRTPEDLFGYHAVIVDDLEAEFFAPDQAQLLQKFVSERGGGFLGHIQGQRAGQQAVATGLDQAAHMGDLAAVIPAAFRARAAVHHQTQTIVRQWVPPAYKRGKARDTLPGQLMKERERRMRAVLSKSVGGPETLVIEDLPSPVAGPGQVVLSVKACGVNYPDVLIIEDMYQFKPSRPFAPGGEVAGVVKELGEGVTHLKVGQRVLANTGWGGMAEELALAAALTVVARLAPSLVGLAARLTRVKHSPLDVAL
eukprot:gene11409-15257_t